MTDPADPNSPTPPGPPDPPGLPHDPEPDPSAEPHRVLIVVGAHLRAEIGDRPLAYRLQQEIDDWQARHEELLSTPVEPTVCTDVWYLNHQELQELPTLSVGGPGVNALTAYFAQQLDEDTGKQQSVVIQVDPDFTDLRACIWGTDHELTVKGVDLFVRQYLEGFLKAVVTQVEPEEG